MAERKPKLPEKKPISVFKNTTDDWFPSWKGGTVKIDLDNFGAGQSEWVITAYGADDRYLVSKPRTYSEALAVFLFILEMEDVSQKAILDLGFTPD